MKQHRMSLDKITMHEIVTPIFENNMGTLKNGTNVMTGFTDITERYLLRAIFDTTLFY